MEITEEEFKALKATVDALKLENEKMSAKNSELLDEVKGTKRKKTELEEAQRLAEEQKAIENGEFKNLLEARTKELEEERAKAQAFKQQVTQKDIDLAASSIAAKLSSSSESNRYLLSREVKDYAEVFEGEVIFKIGGVTVDQQAVVDHLKNKFPSLVDGNPASGDGAKNGTGSTSGGAVSFKDMSRTEKALLAKEDPIKYKQLAGIK